jgi:hypothetical protein
VTHHHRFLLRLHLNQIDALDAAIDTRSNETHARRLVRHLANLGYAVEIKSIAAAA